MLLYAKPMYIDACTAYDLISPKGIEVIWFFNNIILTSGALGKSKASEEMDTIWLLLKSMEKFDFEVKLNEPVGTEPIWLKVRITSRIELNFERSGIFVNLFFSAFSCINRLPALSKALSALVRSSSIIDW